MKEDCVEEKEQKYVDILSNGGFKAFLVMKETKMK